jgi:hypothetical protein
MALTYANKAAFIVLLSLLVLQVPALAASGGVQVYSTPTGAYVCVDDAQCGYAPEDFVVTGDAYHSVAISMSGYQTWTQYIRVSSGATEVINANLARDVSPTAQPTPAPVPETGTGTVRVFVSPAGGMVCIDAKECEVNVGGTEQSGTGTTDFTAVKAGMVHTIEVTNDGYEPYSTQITVLPDQVNEAEVTLRPFPQSAAPAAIPSEPAPLPTTRSGLDAIPVLGALVLCGALIIRRARKQ